MSTNGEVRKVFQFIAENETAIRAGCAGILQYIYKQITLDDLCAIFEGLSGEVREYLYNGFTQEDYYSTPEVQNIIRLLDTMRQAG